MPHTSQFVKPIVDRVADRRGPGVHPRSKGYSSVQGKLHPLTINIDAITHHHTVIAVYPLSARSSTSACKATKLQSCESGEVVRHWRRESIGLALFSALLVSGYSDKARYHPSLGNILPHGDRSAGTSDLTQLRKMIDISEHWPVIRAGMQV